MGVSMELKGDVVENKYDFNLGKVKVTVKASDMNSAKQILANYLLQQPHVSYGGTIIVGTSDKNANFYASEENFKHLRPITISYKKDDKTISRTFVITGEFAAVMDKKIPPM
ncbi:MAG: hypothetical protein ACP5JC_03710 [Candidatus Micrarchaeia archaeon]